MPASTEVNDRGGIVKDNSKLSRRSVLKKVIAAGAAAGFAQLFHPSTSQAHYDSESDGHFTRRSLPKIAVPDQSLTPVAVVAPNSELAALKGMTPKTSLVQNEAVGINFDQSERAKSIIQQVTKILPVGRVLPNISVVNDNQFKPITGFGPYVGCADIHGEFFPIGPGQNKVYVTADNPELTVGWTVHELLHGSDINLNGMVNQLDTVTSQLVNKSREVASQEHRAYVVKNSGDGVTPAGIRILDSVYAQVGTTAWPYFAKLLHTSDLTMSVQDLSKKLSNLPPELKASCERVLARLKQRNAAYFMNDELGRALAIMYYTSSKSLNQFPPELYSELEKPLTDGLERADLEDFAEGGKNLLINPSSNQHPLLYKAVASTLWVITGKTIDQITPQLQDLIKTSHQLP